MVAPLISGVASAAGGMMQANGQAQAQEAQGQLRKGLEENAVKQRDALQTDKKTNKVLSDQLAAFGHSGGGIMGSARVVREATASQGNLNRDQELWEGAQMQQSRETQAKILSMEADALRSAAQTTRKSGVISGISGIAGSFGGMAKASGGGGGGGNFFYG